MNKIQMEIFGLTSSPHNSGAYSLILQETSGLRRLAILIGAEAAQSIVNELEGLKPPRPITHDLLKTIIETLNGNLLEVFIYELRDGTYFANIVIEDYPEIDARPSDAIALAIRTGTPIYVSEDVMNEAGAIPQEGDEFDDKQQEEPTEAANKPLSKREQIEQELKQAIANEEYEKAAKLRDDLSKLDVE